MTDNDPNRSPDFHEALLEFMHGHLLELHTAIPGVIEKYDAATGLADVSPVLKRKYIVDDEPELMAYPVITDVPVAFPRGGGAFVSLPLKKGDPVMLIFSERSLDKFLDSDGASQVDPDNARRHHLSDAMCYPGMVTTKNHIANAHADDLVVGLEDGSAEIHVQPDGVVGIKAARVNHGTLGADKALARADKVDARLDALDEFAATHMHPTAALGPPSPGILPDPFTQSGPPTGSTKVYASA